MNTAVEGNRRTIAPSTEAHWGILPTMTGKVPRTALVVDDEALIRWSVSEGLSDAGWHVRQAGTGADARAALDALGDAPVVLVLDLRLPDVSDLSLVEYVRRTRPDAPVILMTAHGGPDLARTAAALGVYRLVGKPFDIGTLVSLAEQAYTSAAWPAAES